MPKFRKKPIVIEAHKLTAATRRDIIDWIKDTNEGAHACDEGLIIPTLEGDHLASFGDWIIRGVQGEFYPCKPDIFDLTYEPAPEV